MEHEIHNIQQKTFKKKTSPVTANHLEFGYLISVIKY